MEAPMIKKHFPKFNETIYILKLKNGTQVHILPKEDPYFTTYVELSIPYGGMHVTYKHENQLFKTPIGTAHFLEHQIFAMPDGDAFTQFSMLGTDANAMTSYSQTSYLFSATNNVFEALDHLLNMVDTPYFMADSVEQEKQIIAEELKMYLDDPMTQMQNELMEQMYHNHPIQYDIGGTLESIVEITPEILKRTYDHFYHPSNRLIVIAGKVDIARIKDYFKAYQQRFPEKSDVASIIIGQEPKKLVKRHAEKSLELSIDKLMIGIKLSPKRLSKQKRLAREMALSMLFNMVLGASSKMYSELLEKELINHSFYVSTNVEHQAENIMIFGESKNVKDLQERLVNLLSNDMLDNLNEADFNRFKKVYLGQFVYALNSLDTKAYLYGRYFHLQTSLYDVVDLLKEINYQDVLNVSLEIKPNRISTLIYKKV
jgi:predicted Zn-dependent peptidase